MIFYFKISGTKFVPISFETFEKKLKNQKSFHFIPNQETQGLQDFHSLELQGSLILQTTMELCLPEVFYTAWTPTGGAGGDDKKCQDFGIWTVPMKGLPWKFQQLLNRTDTIFISFTDINQTKPKVTLAKLTYSHFIN